MSTTRYFVNVKIPEEYVKLIDKNLKSGCPLSQFTGRAHFVQMAVYRLLLEYGISVSIHPDDISRRRKEEHDP